MHLLAQGSGETAYKEAGVIIHPLPKSEGRWQRYARVAQIAKAAADLKADLYHVHEPDLLGPVIKRVGSRPVIMTYMRFISIFYAQVLGFRG